jgi:hypothetical protein
MNILQDIVHRLGRIEAKLDGMQNLSDRVAKLSPRIRSMKSDE